MKKQSSEKKQAGINSRPVHKIRIFSELIYLPGLMLISFSVALTAASDFGVSTIVAPAYILSEKLGISFGTGEYIVQAFLFILMCIIIKKIKLVYFSSFISGVIYGVMLDGWRLIIPVLNPSVTPPGSFPMWERIMLYCFGILGISFSVALLFKTYFYPQVYDFFVKIVSVKKNLPFGRFKSGFDLCCLGVALILSYSFFSKLYGVGYGTFVQAAVNGFLISFFSKLLDRYFEFPAVFKKAEKLFEM